MTPENAIYEARTFLANTSDHYPVTDAILYARLNARQRQLFAMASMWNREYYGEQVFAPLNDEGCIDLDDLETDDDHLWPIERVDRIEVATAPRNSDYEVGTEVTIVHAHERFSHLKPRVTIRSHVIMAVQDDFPSQRGPYELCLWYSRRPRQINRAGIVEGNKRQEDLEIGDPWDWLLVWDLVKSMINRITKEEAGETNAVWQYASISEQTLLEAYEEHVRGYAYRAEVITD